MDCSPLAFSVERGIWAEDDFLHKDAGLLPRPEGEGKESPREYNYKGVLPRVSLWEVLILAKNVENILLFYLNILIHGQDVRGKIWPLNLS